MTLGASGAEILGRYVGFVVNPALGRIPDRLGFLWCQPVLRTEILDHRPRLRRGECDTVRQDHSLQNFLPIFRRGPLPGNTLHISPFVARVAPAAFGDHQWVSDRDALFTGPHVRLA